MNKRTPQVIFYQAIIGHNDMGPIYGDWYWHVVAGNNRIIADSAEGYKNKADCKKGWRLTASAKE